MFTRSLFLSGVLVLVTAVTSATRTFADPTPNPVIEWASIIQPAIHSAAAPRSGGTSQILHTMVTLAVYDAVVAIEGGYRPYATMMSAPADADVHAAVATAAFMTARPRIAPARQAYLEDAYVSYMAAIPEGPSKATGALVGRRAAEAMLALRANDGFSAVVPYQCSGTPPLPGEFEPDAGCPAGAGAPQPVDVKVGGITPFTLRSASMYRPAGPPPFRSWTYTQNFIETRDYGRVDSAVRTADQTDIAYFWSEHPYVHWNRNLIALATQRELNVREAARFFAMVHTAASDAVIAGFEAKYYYAAWRPRTAIPLANSDDNPRTEADSTWHPLLYVNHPEYPSGHGFWSTALLGAVASYFGTTEVPWTLATSRTAVPQLVVAERTYSDLGTLLGEIGNARIWGGLHWRHAIDDGAKIGGRVAAHVTSRYFKPVPPGQ